MVPEQETFNYVADKDSVKRAIELFKNARVSKKRSKDNSKTSFDSRIASNCNQIVSNDQKIPMALAFLPSYALKEMRHCLMTHDWLGLQRLFPCLLETSGDKISIIWRYIVLIMFHSPMSDMEHLVNFLNLCVGCQNDDHDHILRQLMTLNSSSKKKRSKSS